VQPPADPQIIPSENIEQTPEAAMKQAPEIAMTNILR
jgi:hypothetical protein